MLPVEMAETGQLVTGAGNGGGADSGGVWDGTGMQDGMGDGTGGAPIGMGGCRLCTGAGAGNDHGGGLGAGSVAVVAITPETPVTATPRVLDSSVVLAVRTRRAAMSAAAVVAKRVNVSTTTEPAATLRIATNLGGTPW